MQTLKLTPEALAGIYLGTIKSWRDTAITKSNPGIILPDKPIVVARRSDGSGTTNIFTTYLMEVSPAWAKKVGKGLSVNRPVGLAAKAAKALQVSSNRVKVESVMLNSPTRHRITCP
jgi:phosphate transport system substrate-binding protein